MKTLFTIICGLLCLFVIRTLRKRYFSVSGIFVMIWSVCLCLATCGFFGMDTPTWTVVYLGCISMIIFTISGVVKLPIIKGFNIRLKDNSLSCDILLYILHFIAYIYLFPFFKMSIDIMLTKGIYYVREYAFTSSSYASTAELMIFQIFVQPLFQVMIIFTLLDVRNKKKCGLSIVIAILNLIIYTMLFAGRYIIFQTLVYIVFIMYDTDQVKNIYDFIKQYKKVVVVSSSLILMLLIVSRLRSNSSVFRSAYIYFCGSFSYLSRLIEQDVGVDLYLGGRAQWGFIYNFIYLGVSVLFGVPYKGSSHIITSLTQYSIPIGLNIKYNSLGTMLHDFIADYGVWGSLFGVIIFSLLCNYIEKMRKIRDDGFSLGLYYYILFVVVNSVLGYSFRGPASLTIIMLLYFLGRGKRVERKEL